MARSSGEEEWGVQASHAGTMVGIRWNSTPAGSISIEVGNNTTGWVLLGRAVWGPGGILDWQCKQCVKKPSGPPPPPKEEEFMPAPPPLPPMRPSPQRVPRPVTKPNYQPAGGKSGTTEGMDVSDVDLSAPCICKSCQAYTGSG